jgi:hypothetical protein
MRIAKNRLAPLTRSPCLSANHHINRRRASNLHLFFYVDGLYSSIAYDSPFLHLLILAKLFLSLLCLSPWFLVFLLPPNFLVESSVQNAESVHYHLSLD